MIGEPKNYTFALALVEGKPVYVGDSLYDYAYKSLGEKCKRIVLVEDTELIQQNNRFFWNKPKPTTFNLNGKTFPLPEIREMRAFTILMTLI